MLEHPLALLKSEIPFDFNRKRLSVVVRHADEYLLITKGEAESVFGICETVAIDGVPQPFDNSRRAEAECTLKKLSADGYRALGVAELKVERQDVYAVPIERAMTLVGFAAFLDPPKEGVLSVLQALKQNGISMSTSSQTENAFAHCNKAIDRPSMRKDVPKHLAEPQ